MLLVSRAMGAGFSRSGAAMKKFASFGLVVMVALAVLVAAPLAAQATTWYVSATGSDTAGSGLSLGSSFASVQHAIAHASSGDKVRVGAGTFNGGVTMKNGVSLEATGAGTGKFYAELKTGANFSAVVTATAIGEGTHISGFKIDGATSGTGIYCSNSSLAITDCRVTGNLVGIGCYGDSSPTISASDISGNAGNGIVCNASSPKILLSTINQNHAYGILCTATASPSIAGNDIGSNWSFGIECGGASSPSIVGNDIGGNSLGIDCIGSSSPTITANDIYGSNIAGIKCNASSPSISNDTIRDGSQDGIDCSNGSAPTIAGCTITGNTNGIDCSYSPAVITDDVITGVSQTSGSGIRCDSCAPTIEGCTISGTADNIVCLSTPDTLTIANCTIQDGWFGVDIIDSSPTITNCVISGNYSGVYCESASPTLTNDTIAENSSGIGWYTFTPSSPVITNCILWNAGATEIAAGAATYSDVRGGAAGVGNIDADPGFVSSSTGDFHLSAGSPCIDVATSAGAPATDRDGTPRPFGAGSDMGAYEYHPATWRLHYAAGANGSIAGATTQVLTRGSDGTSVTAVPDSANHYHFVEWSDHAHNAERRELGVTADATYTATFAIDTFTVTVTAGANGTITPSGDQAVPYGSSKIFSVKPNTGYRISGVAKDGASIGASSSVTFPGITEAGHSIEASFTKLITAASISRSPNKSTVTYSRKGGVAKFTLSAVVKGWGSKAISGRYVYLQTSTSGKTWSSTYKLKTGSSGKASRSFKVTRKQVRYYRWYAPAISQVCLKTYSKPTKVTVK
jgi:hypothetical protein